MNYCVYKHTFPNGKVYIGITCKKPERRWGRDGRGYKDTQPIMVNAINKYGWDNIQHEVLYKNLSKEEAEDLEIKLIKQYKSNNIEFGYNVENGGNAKGKTSDETRRKLSEINKGKKQSLEAVQKRADANRGDKCYWYNSNGYWDGKHLSEETKQKISEAQSGENHRLYGKHLSEETKQKLSKSQMLKKGKGVRCVETGIVYRSQKDASRQTGIDRSDIGKCCNGKQKTAGGYHWESISDYIVEGSSVRCVETGVIYNSIADASKKTGVYSSGISGVCHGRQKIAGGYHWEFVDNNLKKYPKENNKIKEERNSKCQHVLCVETNITYKLIKDAAKSIGIHSSGISKCCHGRQDTAGGYHWKFVEGTPIDVPIKLKNNKQVRCVETGIVYKSQSEAERQTNILATSIGQCCLGKYKTAGGYHWEYVDKH